MNEQKSSVYRPCQHTCFYQNKNETTTLSNKTIVNRSLDRNQPNGNDHEDNQQVLNDIEFITIRKLEVDFLMIVSWFDIDRNRVLCSTKLVGWYLFSSCRHNNCTTVVHTPTETTMFSRASLNDTVSTTRKSLMDFHWFHLCLCCQLETLVFVECLLLWSVVKELVEPAVESVKRLKIATAN